MKFASTFIFFVIGIGVVVCRPPRIIYLPTTTTQAPPPTPPGPPPKPQLLCGYNEWIALAGQVTPGSYNHTFGALSIWDTRPHLGVEPIKYRSNPYARTEFPWHVFIYESVNDTNNSPSCSAALIYDQWVLTSAKCPALQKSRQGKTIDVRMAFDWVKEGYIQTKHCHQVPSTNVFFSDDNAMAMLKLENPMDFVNISDEFIENQRDALMPWQLHPLCLPMYDGICTDDGRYYNGTCEPNNIAVAVGANPNSCPADGKLSL